MTVPIRAAAGGVVYAHADNGDRLILLICDKYGHWTLPKGHLEANETEEVAAVREIAEETGIRCTLGPLVQRIQYPVQKKGVSYQKHVAYFLARAAYTQPTPQTAEGITIARWINPDHALSLIGYEQVREVVRLALAMLP